jgi:PKD repeat protein
MAQNSVTVMGSVTPCSGVSYPVWIFSGPGTTPAVDTVINTTVNCTYSYTFFPNNTSGGITVLLSCDGGITWAISDSAIYTIDPNLVDTLVMNLGCGVPNCQASFNMQQAIDGNTPIPWQMTTTNTSTGGGPLTFTWWMPDGSASYLAEPGFTFGQSGVYGICLTISADNGNCTSTLCDTVIVDSMGYISTSAIWYDCSGLLWGTNLPGTSCTDSLGNNGIWSTACMCIANIPPCVAGFLATQAYDTTGSGGVEPIPNNVWIYNLSSGGNGSYQFVWEFGDGDSSNVAYPTHEYAGPGPYTLCLTMYSGGCTDTYCDSVSIDANGILNGMVIDGHPADQDQRTNGFTLNVLQPTPAGIEQVPAFADLRLWPNPAQTELNLSFNNTLYGAVSVKVIDPTGRLVIGEEHNLALGRNTLRLNTAVLQPGLYVVRIGNDAHSLTHRFMKVN